MSNKAYLIFASFEVGGIPFKMAEVLNRHGVKVYYVSVPENLARSPSKHDTTTFHYGGKNYEWDLSKRFENLGTFERIKSELRVMCDTYGFKSCLAVGSKSYWLHDVGVPYVYWSYGADLDQLCYEKRRWFSPEKYVDLIMRGGLTRLAVESVDSIRHAGGLFISPYQFDSYKALGVEKPLVFLPHFFSVPDCDELEQYKNRCASTISKKLECRRYLFSSVRHVWGGGWKELSDNKGNEIAISAFANYLTLSGDKDVRLVLINKGNSVEESRRLIDKIGIGSSVAWVGEMPRPMLNEYYAGATCCLGQFGTPCLTWAVLEPLVFGVPCVSYYGKRILEAGTKIPYYGTQPPIFDSCEPEEIGSFLADLMSSEIKYKRISDESMVWLRNNCTEEVFIDAFIKAMEFAVTEPSSCKI